MKQAHADTRETVSMAYDIERFSAPQLAAIADAFSLLAILCDCPNEQLALACVDDSLKSDIDSLCKECGIKSSHVLDALAALDIYCKTAVSAESLLYELRCEYTRLFNHPERPRIPLYEEQFLFEYASSSRSQANQVQRGKHFDDLKPRMFVNPASIDAMREYRQAGMKQADERAIPADAMPVQMSFLAQLFTRALEAKTVKHDNALAAVAGQIGEFCHYHLDKWMAEFFGACTQVTCNPLYKTMGLFGVDLFWVIRDKDV